MGRSADALPGDRLQDRKVRDEKPAQLHGGRMLQLPLYMFAGAELLGLDPAAGEAAYVYATRRGEVQRGLVDRSNWATPRGRLAGLGALLEGIAAATS